MSDLISREAAIEAIEELVSTMSVCVSMEECKGMNWMKQRAIAAIKELPSAQPEDQCSECDAWNKYKNYGYSQWIPVSERLPEVGRNVLLSVGKGLYTAEGELNHDGTWVQYRWSANIENVDAWAEMPEPWRGEEDE